MNSHKNARTCLHSRALMVRRALEDGHGVKSVAADFGVSERTVHKWLARFHRVGHRITGDRRQNSGGAGWEYVHVCVDDHSRLAYVEVLKDERKKTAHALRRRRCRPGTPPGSGGLRRALP